MKKIITLMSLCLVPFFIIACSNKNTNSELKSDYADVYDQSDKQITRLTNKKEINYLSDIAGSFGETKITSLPRDAKLTYRYEMHQVKDDTKVNLKVFETQKGFYGQIKNLPILDKLTFKLTEKQAEVLNNPLSLIKNKN